MAYFFEEEPDDWAEEQQNAQQQQQQEQQQNAEDGPPEEYQPEPWEIDGVAADAGHSGRSPAEYDPLAPNARGGCRNCDSFTVDLRWREAFGVYLCHSCKRDVELISKGKAKEKYLLTDGDLKKLGSLSKSNPQKKEWSAMKLYLIEQVEEVAEKKHGTYEDIEMRRERQEQSRIQRRIEKRSMETKKVNQVKAKLARIRREIEAANAAAESSNDRPTVIAAAAEVELI